jgi:hypothetical protein
LSAAPAPAAVKLCYLCGEKLSRPHGKDHVPPRQLFAASIRRKYSPRMDTVKVHDACNRAYQKDEDYFVAAFLPFARGSESGEARIREIVEQFHSARPSASLTKMVLSEFHRVSPAGVVFPPGLIGKKFDMPRINRVAWKVARGLHFMETGEVLPPDIQAVTQIALPPNAPEEGYLAAMDGIESRGRHQGVFAWRYRCFEDRPSFHFWAFLLWDRIMLFVLADLDPDAPAPAEP